MVEQLRAQDSYLLYAITQQVWNQLDIYEVMYAPITSGNKGNNSFYSLVFILFFVSNIFVALVSDVLRRFSRLKLQLASLLIDIYYFVLF